MNRKYFLIIITASFFALAFGCTGKTVPMAGNGTVSEPTGINRIISAAPAYTEIIAGLGLADKLIAVDKYSKGVKGVRQDLPEIDFFYPDIEAITALKPDIIISGEINTNGIVNNPYQFFRRLGIMSLQIPTGNSIRDIYDSIILIAQTLDVEERGEALVKNMEEQITIIAGRAAAHGDQDRLSVYFEIAPAPNMVSFGSGTYLNELIETIGAVNIFAAENRWLTPGPEAIIRANPDVIFILSNTGMEATETAGIIAELKNRPGFSALAAVRQGRVYPIDENHASRPSQNIVLALEGMYRAVIDSN